MREADNRHFKGAHAMDIDEIRSICPDLNFKNDDIYMLVRFIPLVAVMMADGQRQQEEINLFYKFVKNFIHITQIQDQYALNITDMDVRRFFAPFIQTPVSSNRKHELSQLCDYLFDHFKQNWTNDKKMDIYDMCMEIAAAAPVPHCPLGIQRRISPEERKLLMEMIRALGLDLPPNQL
jgi:hypothetical protein